MKMVMLRASPECCVCCAWLDRTCCGLGVWMLWLVTFSLQGLLEAGEEMGCCQKTLNFPKSATDLEGCESVIGEGFVCTERDC